MICNTCGIDKDTSLFRRRTDREGWYNKCSDCKRDYNKQYYQRNKNEMIRKQRINYKENAVDRRRQKKEYSKTHRGRDVSRRATIKWHNNNPQKMKASQEVNNAIGRGEIPPIKIMKCRDCGKQAHDYHHWSYLKEHWLDVVPLCRICHKAEHKRLKSEGIVL